MNGERKRESRKKLSNSTERGGRAKCGCGGRLRGTGKDKIRWDIWSRNR